MNIADFVLNALMFSFWGRRIEVVKAFTCLFLLSREQMHQAVAAARKKRDRNKPSPNRGVFLILVIAAGCSLNVFNWGCVIMSYVKVANPFCKLDHTGRSDSGAAPTTI